MAGWDVVVHFNTKEAADKYALSIKEQESVSIAGEFAASYCDFLEATHVETWECPQ